MPVGYKHDKEGMIMTSTRFTVASVSNGGMIMKSGCDTGYYVSSDGRTILKGGCSTNLSVDNNGKIMKGGSDTGYVINGGSIMQNSENGYNIDWIFN